MAFRMTSRSKIETSTQGIQHARLWCRTGSGSELWRRTPTRRQIGFAFGQNSAMRVLLEYYLAIFNVLQVPERIQWIPHSDWHLS